MKKVVAGIMTMMLAVRLCGCEGSTVDGGELTAKPIIYLYPEKDTEVSVRLDYDGELTVTWPVYEDGWNVTARPDGTLLDAEGNAYSYLFWEGVTDAEYDFSKGFCVAGEDTADFLRETLAEIGLTPEEYNEFIVYWLPQMQDNAYNLISFQQERYTQAAQLDITPEPDSMLRVFMAWKPLDRPRDIVPQEFPAFQREGFTIVEWGGTKVS